MNLFKFSTGNAKLGKRLIFSLPAGHSCPGAGLCRTYASRVDGTIIDHPIGDSDALEFRCFAAMAETRPNVRNARWHNWDVMQAALKQDGDPAHNVHSVLMASLDAQPVLDLVRVHESGDYKTLDYMKGWMLTATARPHQKFYSYTKSLPVWLALHDQMPNNFYLTASFGGLYDSMITQYPEVFKRYARVVYSQQEADSLGLSVDHDDSHCFKDQPFALIVHGSQRAGSAASKAIATRRKLGGFVGYNKAKAVH